MATFSCRASGVSVYWFVNGSTVPRQGSSTYINQGWIFTDHAEYDNDGGINHIFDLTLRIPVNIIFNNTEIACGAVINSVGFSDTAYLIIS